MTKNQLSVTYACGAQDYWDLEPDGSLRIDIPQAEVVVAEYEAKAAKAALHAEFSRGFNMGIESGQVDILDDASKAAREMHETFHERLREIESKWDQKQETEQ